jgi:hypothetical protein
MILATTTVTYFPTYAEADSNDLAPLDDIHVDVAGATAVPACITFGNAKAAGQATLSVGADDCPEVGWRVQDESTGDKYQVDSVQRAGPLFEGWVVNLVLIP